MKTLVRLFATALLVLSIQSSQAYVGFVNETFGAGYTLFANPLQNATNQLSTWFTTASGTPDGTIVSLWNPGTLSFDTSSTFTSGSWTVDLTLNPGTGALLYNPGTSFIGTFVGELLNHDGTLLTGDPPTFTPPPLFSGPNGIYLMADKAPISAFVSTFFVNVIGRAPNDGEQVITLSGTSTFSFGVWDSDPSIPVGQSAFFNIGPSGSFDPNAVIPVPEPSAMGLVLLGIVLLSQRFRRRGSAPLR